MWQAFILLFNASACLVLVPTLCFLSSLSEEHQRTVDLFQVYSAHALLTGLTPTLSVLKKHRFG